MASAPCATGSPTSGAAMVNGRPILSASGHRRRARADARHAADRLISKLQVRLSRAGLAPRSQPDAIDREVARRQAIARPALRARIAGEWPSGPSVLKRNVAEHAAVAPDSGAPLADFRAAQRGPRLGADVGPLLSAYAARPCVEAAGVPACPSPLATLPDGASYWLCAELDRALTAASAPTALPLVPFVRLSDATRALGSLSRDSDELHPSAVSLAAAPLCRLPFAADGRLAQDVLAKAGDNLSTPGVASVVPSVRPASRPKGGDNPYSNPKVCHIDNQRSRNGHVRRPRQRRLAQPGRRHGQADLDSTLEYNLQLLAQPGRRPSQADLDSTLEYNLQLLFQDPALQQLLETDLPPVAVAGRWVTSPLLLQQLRHAPWRSSTRFQ